MEQSFQNSLPTIEHAGYLQPLDALPAYLFAEGEASMPHTGQFACHFCGVGTSARVPLQIKHIPGSGQPLGGVFQLSLQGQHAEFPALLHGGYLQLLTEEPVVSPGELLEGHLETEKGRQAMRIRAFDTLLEPDGSTLAQRFLVHPGDLEQDHPQVLDLVPTVGCRKFQRALGEKPSLYPLHLRPSVLDITGRRVPLFYEEALERFADLVLEHRPPRARTLLYASGQIDYFAVFAIQEVFRLLGVRNMTSNCEHGYLSGGLYKSFVAGDPGPFVSIEQALQTEQPLYLLNGWNGSRTHPPIFQGLLQHPQLDAYLVEVMMTETARDLASRLGPERVLIIRSGGDSHLALAIAHEILCRYPGAIEERFLTHFAERESFEAFAALARSDTYEAHAVAARLAPEFKYRERILRGIHEIAAKLVRQGSVPVHIPSMGFSQTRGIVPHCLWANLLAMLGKFGLKADRSLAGGVLQLPGQANHETHLQGLSPQHFMGRIPVSDAGAAEAAQRLGLPSDAYDKTLMVTARSALDFSEPDSRKELYIFFGGQFAANMMNRPRWLRKLTAQQAQFIVIDPAPDEFALKHAALILPTPPHVAATRLFQSGEWRLSLSLPRRQPSSQTRSDATIVYDLMGTIARMLRTNRSLWLQHPDLSQLISSGYMAERFEASGLPRLEGEVNRALLWERIQSYLSGEGGNGQPLYCRPEHADGQTITWSELLTQGQLLHGGIGQRRQILDYDRPEDLPFQDLYRQGVKYRFFVPTEIDLNIPRGLVLSTGRASLWEDSEHPDPTLEMFNFDKMTPPMNLPADSPLFVSHMLAERYNLAAGDRVWVTNRETRHAMVLKVIPTARLKGETVYLSIHKNRRELERHQYVNLLTSHRVRCPYTGQSGHKLTRVELQKVEDSLRP